MFFLQEHPASKMTYIVSGGALNSTHSLAHSRTSYVLVQYKAYMYQVSHSAMSNCPQRTAFISCTSTPH